jgi:hypothetical protein
MNKINDTKSIEKTQAEEKTVETVETVELENVTGGCAACGCGRPNGAGFRFGANFRRF